MEYIVTRFVILRNENRMNTKSKEDLIIEWKQLRGNFFNLFNEDQSKFEKYYSHHTLYPYVIKHFDKNFTEINQLAEIEIDKFLNKRI